jgi:hypothetical protein
MQVKQAQNETSCQTEEVETEQEKDIREILNALKSTNCEERKITRSDITSSLHSFSCN